MIHNIDTPTVTDARRESPGSRILHIVDVLHFDGRTSVLRDVLTNDSQDEHLIVALMFPGPRAAAFTDLGYPVYSLELASRRTNVTKQLRSLFRVIALRPDLVVIWSGKALVPSILPWLLRRKVIWTIHNSRTQWQSLRERWALRIAKVFSRFVPELIICCSNETKRIYRDCHQFSTQRMFVIPNGVDISKFDPDETTKRSIRTELDVSEDDLLCYVVGRYDYHSADPDSKYIEGAIAAFQRASQQHRNLRLVLIGPNLDADNQTLGSWIAEHEIAHAVRLLGRQSDVARLMIAADFFMSASPNEGLPISLLEAMASGAIPICIDTGGIRDAVREFGTVITQGEQQIAELAAALSEAASRPEAQRQLDARRISAYAKNAFDSRRVAAQYHQAFYQALNN